MVLLGVIKWLSSSGFHQVAFIAFGVLQCVIGCFAFLSTWLLISWQEHRAVLPGFDWFMPNMTFVCCEHTLSAEDYSICLTVWFAVASNTILLCKFCKPVWCPSTAHIMAPMITTSTSYGHGVELQQNSSSSDWNQLNEAASQATHITTDASSPVDFEGKLKSLKKLLDEGVVTPVEYEKKKTDILDRL